MESLALLGVVLVVALLSHQAATKPTGVNEQKQIELTGVKEEEINNLEEELKQQKPNQEKNFDGNNKENIGEWGDTINGINVGNVIKDVLITLRDHPEIVQKLIEDEERSLAEKVLSSERTEFPIEDVGDFQQLSPQLQQSPKKVVKKNYKYEAKRQKEIPEETIDMTDPVEGGSLEDDSTEVKSGEVKHLIKDTEQLSEDRLQQHLSEIKRNKHSSEESSSESSSGSSDQSISEENPKEINTKKQKEAYWKNYGKQKQKPSYNWRVYKEHANQKENRKLESNENNKSNENEQKSVSKGKYWKNYGKNSEKQSKENTNKAGHGKDRNKNSGKNGKISKAEYWKNYGKQKKESQENLESPLQDDKSSNERNEDELFDLEEEKVGSTSM